MSVSDTLQLMLTFGKYTVSLIASAAALIDNNHRKKTIAPALTGRRLSIYKQKTAPLPHIAAVMPVSDTSRCLTKQAYGLFHPESQLSARRCHRVRILP